MPSSRHDLADHELANVFRKLLSKHSALLSSISASVPVPSPAPTSHQAQDFKKFLDGYTEVYSVPSKTEAEQEKADVDEAKHNRPVFESFLDGYHEALKQWKTAQRDKADDFNLMAVM